MSRRRILIVVNHAGFFLSHRLPVALAAQSENFDVHVATPGSKHVPQILANGLTWHRIRLARSSTNPLQDIRTVASLFRLYRRLAPDLVHHVTTKPVVYGTLAARAAGVPAVVNAISGPGHYSRVGPSGDGLLEKVVSIGHKWALRHPKMKVIFQNPQQRKEFVDSGWVRGDETELVPGSGVDMDQFAPRVGPEPKPLVVSLVSRLLWTKGVGEFVAAARQLRSEGFAARFVLVGEPDPDNKGSLTHEEAAALESEGVVECWGRRSDVPTVLRQSAIACLPTYGEGLPRSLVEAAACGLPIVTTDIPGCNWVVRDGVNGFLVKPRDTSTLTDALRKLLQSAELRRTFGEAGRARVVRDFSLTRVVAEHLRIYRELVCDSLDGVGAV